MATIHAPIAATHARGLRLPAADVARFRSLAGSWLFTQAALTLGVVLAATVLAHVRGDASAADAVSAEIVTALAFSAFVTAAGLVLATGVAASDISLTIARRAMLTGCGAMTTYYVIDLVRYWAS